MHPRIIINLLIYVIYIFYNIIASINVMQRTTGQHVKLTIYSCIIYYAFMSLDLQQCTYFVLTSTSC